MLYFFDKKTGLFRRIKTGRFVRDSLVFKRSKLIRNKYPKNLKRYRSKLGVENYTKPYKKTKLPAGFTSVSLEATRKFNIKSIAGKSLDWFKAYFFIEHDATQELEAGS